MLKQGREYLSTVVSKSYSSSGILTSIFVFLTYRPSFLCRLVQSDFSPNQVRLEACPVMEDNIL